MNRQERRAALRAEQAKQMLNLQSGGYGLGNQNAIPATGQTPIVNPFIIPKSTGLGITTQTFLNNYYVNWTPETWRYACDQAMKMGWPIAYATLVSWCYESSSFVRSLFKDLEDMSQDAEIVLADSKGNKLDDWTEEICLKNWFIKLKKEIIAAEGWGFTCLNIDPLGNKIYKYPMQQIDPINQMLRESTFNYSDGMRISDYANLIFIQPSTSYEEFLGWMQPVAREYIQMNMLSTTWLAAARRLAFPLMTIGYPQSGAIQDEDGNEINLDKISAEQIAASADPTKSVVYPYTRKPDGTIEKSVEIDFAGGNAGRANAHLIFSDFEKMKKEEIREMVFGENLTSTTEGKGSNALGQVHERKHFRRERTKIEWLLSYLNDPEFIGKLSKFYKNFPQDIKFKTNISKEWELDDVKTLSDVLNANGKQLSQDFFFKIGVAPEDLEDKPDPIIPPQLEQLPNKDEKQSTLKKKLNSLAQSIRS